MWRVVAVVVLVALTANAEDVPASPGIRLTDMMAARNLAMGGAYHSLGYGTETIGGNPAGLSLYRRFQIELHGAYDFSNVAGLGTIGLVDSATTELALGLSYTFATFGGQDRRWAHVTTLALAIPLAEERVHIGLSVRHYGLLGATTGNTFTLAGGVLIRPIKELTFGLGAHNIVLAANPDVVRYFTAAISALIKDQFTPALDVRLEFVDGQPRVAIHGGVEWLVAKTVPLRLGYQADLIRQHQYLSGGIGYFVEGSGVDFAYRHEFGGDNGRMIMLTLKLQLNDN